MTETNRLLLREMNPDDFHALFLVPGDSETMWHYPYAFDGQHVNDWIERNMNRYRKDVFGLWAVCSRAFRNTDYPSLYSHCRYTNVPFIKTVESIGMQFVCKYPDETNGTIHVSAISREEWLNEITERSTEQE